GLIKMVDDGENDEKIICVPAKDPRYDHIQDLADLSAHIPKEIQHFFEHYKDLQNKKCQILAIEGAASAKEMIISSKENHA
ncbi:MAG: inorganic diphosphatase, partial [Candidatus Berkelbacteria bacterium Gr01-1014_85]